MVDERSSRSDSLKSISTNDNPITIGLTTLIFRTNSSVDVPKENAEIPKQQDKPPEPVTGPVPLPPKQLIIVFVGLFFGILMASLDQTIVSTALPAISSDLGGLEVFYSKKFLTYFSSKFPGFS
jgi:hypothetical protein